MHQPAKPSFGGSGLGKKLGGGKKGSSALSALTLLSFLFFINLLQGCIKDHMDAMNPTVMVMTTNIIRNRFNKMGEMNSREQNSGYSSNSANIVMQPADLVAAAAAQSPTSMDSARPSVNIQSPYSSNAVSYNKPLETNIPAPSYVPQSLPQPQYVQNTPEPEVPIKYAKPQYDPYKPEPHLPAPQHTLSYSNHTIVVQSPPIQTPSYNLPPQEQHYNYHHTEYSAQPVPQPTIVIAQHSISTNPFYEHQHPDTSKPYDADITSQYYGPPADYNYRQKYDMPSPSVISNNKNPWSSNHQISSVLSGPYRRASVISVSPKTKWISVPAKITDHSNFPEKVESIVEDLEHHDDRDVFHTRFN